VYNSHHDVRKHAIDVMIKNSINQSFVFTPNFRKQKTTAVLF
jgi:hypothetical protein